jgi:hypothetical protein
MRQMRLFKDRLDALPGPYAPLGRFGNYMAVGLSDEYRAAQDAKDFKRMAELESDPEHYAVFFAESYGEAYALRNQMLTQTGFKATNIRYGQREEFTKQGTEAPWMALRRLKAIIDSRSKDARNDADTKKMHRRINALLNDLYLSTLAETSARKHNLRRRNIAGASDEMLRAFASKGKADAHFIAALQSNGLATDALQEMRDQAHKSTDPDAMAALNRILARHTAGLQYDETPILDKMMQFNSVWQLLTKPGYYLQNATQPWMMSLPYMATIIDKGTNKSVAWDRSFAALARAYKDVTPAFKDGAFLKGLHTGKFDIDALAISDAEKELLRDLQERGKLSVGIARDMGYWEAKGQMSQHVAGALHRMNTWVKQVELMNRATTAVATYRLAGGENNATEAAAKVVEVLDDREHQLKQ